MKKRIAAFLVFAMMLVSACLAETGTDIEKALRAIQNHEVKEFSISTLQFGPLSTDAVDGTEYATHLLEHFSFEKEDKTKWPDGEYIVLNFPKDNQSFLFFYGNEELVGEEKDGETSLYRAKSEQENVSVLSMMQQWYDAMAAALHASEDWLDGHSDQDAIGKIVDGSYLFSVKVREGDTGKWEAEDLSQDDTVVKLGEIKNENGLYEVRYDPVADGEINVGVRHFTDGVCDEVHEFVLKVKDGKITEVPSGSYTASPDDSDLDAFLSGEWAEVETQFTVMTVKKNEGRGWNVEIISPVSHGAYVFKANIGYDCDLDGFVYSDGSFYEVPITAEETSELGDPVAENISGILRFEKADGNSSTDVHLSWYNSSQPDETVIFERMPDVPEQ